MPYQNCEDVCSKSLFYILVLFERVFLFNWQCAWGWKFSNNLIIFGLPTDQAAPIFEVSSPWLFIFIFLLIGGDFSGAPPKFTEMNSFQFLHLLPGQNAYNLLTIV